jgi:hypothetical protein
VLAFELTLSSQIFGRQFKIPSSDRNLSYIPFDGISGRNDALDISSGDLREIPESPMRRQTGASRRLDLA